MTRLKGRVDLEEQPYVLAQVHTLAGWAQMSCTSWQGASQLLIPRPQEQPRLKPQPEVILG